MNTNIRNTNNGSCVSNTSCVSNMSCVSDEYTDLTSGKYKIQKINGKYMIVKGESIDPPSAAKPKKSKIKTEKIVSFDEAVLDFLRTISVDIDSLPNLPEYYSCIEKDGAFPVDDVEKWNRNRYSKNCVSEKRKATHVNTIIKKDMIIVVADPQLGKAKFTICISIKSMLEERTPIIVVRPLKGDMNKAEIDYEGVSKHFDAYMNDHNITDKKFNITTIRGDKLSNIGDLDMFNKSINKEHLSIVIVLGNESQLEKIYDVVKDKPSTYDLLIDEIDYVDYGSDSKTSNMLALLKQNSYQTYGITATPMDTLFSEEELTTANMIRLSKPHDYRGFVDFQVKLLEKDPDTVGLSVSMSYDEIIESDRNFEPFIKQLSKQSADWSWDSKKYYPRICLIKISHLLDIQNELYDGIHRNYGHKFVTIVNNGDGIRMNFSGMKTIIIAGKTVNPDEYVELAIPDVLQYLFDNGCVKKFPRIIIIAGKLAGRCTSYVSRNYDWHLTDMYYNPAKSTPIPEMIQSAGRLCGRNRLKSPFLILHTTMRVSEALYDGFHFTNEIITRAIANPLIEYGDEVNFKNSILSIPMNTDKFPKGRHMTTKVKLNKSDFNLVKGDDDGIDLEDYKYTKFDQKNINAIKKKNMEVKNTKKDVDDVVDVDDDISESLIEVGEEEFKRLVGIFAKWSNDDTKIARFMQNLDPLKIYTEKEMKHLCEETSIVVIKQLLHGKIGNNGHGFGTIIQKLDNTYRLHPCLVEEFNKHF